MITYDDNFKNEYVNAIAVLFEGGTFQLFDAADTLLGTVGIPADAFANASGGAAILNASFDLPITVAGTATAFKAITSGGGVQEGTVGTSGEDLNFAVVTFNIGDTARIQTWRISFPVA